MSDDLQADCLYNGESLRRSVKASKVFQLSDTSLINLAKDFKICDFTDKVSDC